MEKEILKDEQIEEKEMVENEVDCKMEYPITVGVKVNGNAVEMTLDEKGITIGDTTISKEDILLVNRYINMYHLKNEPTFTVVYKLDEQQATKIDFVENIELNDTNFNDKVAFWLKTEQINFEENDWNGFCPIVNGYLKYRYVSTEVEVPEEPKTINALALGGAIAGLLIMIFGGVMLGIGKTIFGATGLGLGFLSTFIGGFNLIKKK
ncbi:MAG: hypothetical protein J6R34_02130 [Clostridia bacterium]|nr:hypothetical protein [Clostridia bacterium]